MSEAGLPSTPAPSAGRRAWLTGAVAAGAVAAGAGLAWWRTRPGDAAVDSLWSLSFQTPQGSALPLAPMRGRPLLVNFWATWCPPCVEEMPLLDSFFRQQASKGWQVVGLAVDQPSAVRTWLHRSPVSFPIGLAGLEGTELAKSLGNLSGGLPFTVVVGREGQVLQRRMGRVTEADLAAWAQAA
jgi:thiol-disulfide isomerase/thioredoxin